MPRPHRSSPPCPASARKLRAGCRPPRATTPTTCAGKPPSPTCAAPRPLPTSSGRTNRHRLSRGGDRQAGRALHTFVPARMRYDRRTRDFVGRRTAEGLTLAVGGPPRKAASLAEGPRSATRTSHGRCWCRPPNKLPRASGGLLRFCLPCPHEIEDCPGTVPGP
ncbi:transposase [Streptomyces sp. NPDC046931]|uniref:transposase n=1 Tax=Streptomyces sp. NPDC046931 TaxID=3154806 RepID=UPI0033EFF94B